MQDKKDKGSRVENGTSTFPLSVPGLLEEPMSFLFSLPALSDFVGLK